MAPKLNPLVKYFDPLRLGQAEFWDNTNEETIGFLRHSEIKHGRVAMAAFVGYIVQSNGINFPWAPFDAIKTLSPPEQWDELPDVSGARRVSAPLARRHRRLKPALQPPKPPKPASSLRRSHPQFPSARQLPL
jgi:hypothetical protein